jgi:Uma2 family endonuclease
MARETFAPWAEVVPGAPFPMTVNQLLALPDDGSTYELVEGRLVRMAPSGGGASSIGARLVSVLVTYADATGSGVVTAADGEYVLSTPGHPDTAFAPDAAFVRADRVPARNSPEWDKAWRLAPDLAVEIASPNQFRPEMAEKSLRYLAAGVRLVWVVWPKHSQADVWRPGSNQPVATLHIGDQLDGLEVLPGFSYPLARLFA